MESEGLGRVDHVGLVVADTTSAVELYGRLFGLRADESLNNEREGVLLTFLHPRTLPSEATSIELLQPTRPDTGVARYLEKRGEGMHHVCFEVDDVQAQIDRLRGLGYELLDQTPRRGLHDEKLAFVHPRSARGVLIELYERGSRRAH